MTATNQTIRLPAGDARTVRFVCARPDGLPINLNGATCQLSVATSLHPTSSDVRIEKAGTIDTVTINGQQFWRANFELIEGDTLGWEPMTYWYQCEVRLSGKPYTAAEGQFVVKGDLVF